MSHQDSRYSNPGDTSASTGKPRLELDATRHFPAWLNERGISLAFTTYQTGKLFLIGLRPDAGISIFERTFNRCMGLFADPDAESLYMSSLYQLWHFTPAFPRGQSHEGYDRLYVPRTGYTTGDLDIHDIALDDGGNPVFVSTLFSCVATVSSRHSFRPVWQPPWISRLAAEDRCHLNGLAMENGRPRYVTSVSRSDVNDGWREHRRDGGIVHDVASGEAIVEGLSMPHSPRIYRDRLWVLNSGTGELGYVDTGRGKFEPIAFLPGFLRGLAFSGDYAVVGLSLPRHNKSFQGLPLDDILADKHAEPRCGLAVINLNNGDVEHSLRLSGIVEELYDVVVLNDVRRPMALGFKTDEISRVISIDDSQKTDNQRESRGE